MPIISNIKVQSLAIIFGMSLIGSTSTAL